MNLLEDVLAGKVKLTPDLTEGIGRLYDASLRRADTRVGELLDLLDAEGVAKHSMVVITSDHGELLGETGLVDHQLSIREELLRVPLLVRFPGRVKPGRIARPISLVQVFQWFLQAKYT